MISTASAQTAGEKIGQVSFPISCNPAVQKPFERGVALLHSFWYLESVKAFTAVTQADPDCAMGYRGIAMSLWNQIWSPPSWIDADKIAALRDALQQAKNTYWAEQVEIQRRAAAAWVARAEGKNDEALRLMRSAAELEEATEKHNITPGPIATPRELYGDLLMDLGQPAQAVREYEASLKLAPARFKALHGAGRAAELADDRETAKSYYVRLVGVATCADTQRPELAQAKAFLGSK
jgi:tetratricopeptide (TPR) repeat protein